ncbi:helix-turn-helix transcriptional regulator [Candidatus Babeliales bacterium]|nr:helix-turn-helix transcriptional regulator [Candidatus Babeliales bacterium]MBP9844135.1 helix-turn-helix transcriptional regulator [Candidatus Babeliales bacterium]
MEKNNFWKNAELRLGADRVAEIKKEAESEAKILLLIQQFITSSVEEYMEKNKVGFNELSAKLGSSPSHLSKIRKGQANLTISSFARLMATLQVENFDFLKLTK